MRVYPATRGPLTFNPTESSARFRPIRTSAGEVVPTMYGAVDETTALLESVLRWPAGSPIPTRIYRVEIEDLEIATLLPMRDLSLVQLHGTGLRALGLDRAEVIDTPESRYPATAELAQVLHDDPSQPDGLIWTSRQNDSSRALMLFGDRVNTDDLTAPDPTGRLALGTEPGLTLVRRLCLECDVDFDG